MRRKMTPMERKKARREGFSIVWWVGHDDYGTAVVEAPDWEQATVEAARWWGAPWAKIAAGCYLERREEVPRLICVKCGKVTYGGPLCPLCLEEERGKAASAAAARRRYYRELHGKALQGGAQG